MMEYIMSTTSSGIQLYEILKHKLGNKEAEALVGFVDSRIKENNEVNLKNFSTQQDITSLRQDMADLRLDLSAKIAETTVKIAETKTEVLRWVFAFYIPLLLSIIGLYLKK